MSLKILMLPKWYPSYLDFAEGNYVERHIKTISDVADVAVLYVHSVDTTETGDSAVTLDEINGFPVVRVFFKKCQTGLSIFDKPITFCRYIQAQFAGYRLIKKTFGKPAIAHVHVLTRTCFFALYLKWTQGIRFIITEHWSGFLQERNAFGGILKPLVSRWLARQSEYITCVSEIQKNGMLSYGFKGKFAVIPNVVNTDLFVPLPVSISNGRKRIIHISRLDSHPKNVPGILRALQELRKMRSDFDLHLLGDGVEADKQKDLVRDLNLEDIVFFHGYKSQQVVAEMLGNSSFLLMFSNYETQSCAILEAFACGIPVIATTVGGIPEIMDTERGILVQKGEEYELALAANKMLDSFDRYNREAIRNYALNNFSKQIIGNSFLKIYSEILSAH